jgi:MFS family permease
MVNSLVIVSGSLTVISKIVKSYVPFIFGRFLTGIYCGLFTGVGPLYLSEIAPKNLRGAAGTLNQLAIVIGILLTNVMGLPQIFGTSELWPYLIGATIIPTMVHFIFFPFCVETPKFIYINRNDPQQAEKSMI